MPMVIAEISMSLDGYVAGPEPTLEDPLGRGGMQLHEWAFRLAAWRAPHGLEGGESGPESELVQRSLAATGAVVMGRRMFSGGEGPWRDDPNGTGWWGEDPPFHVPVFVVTHHERETLPMQGGTSFAFVTAGVEAAVGQAQQAAGGGNVAVAGGASVVRQCLAAGLLDELQIHLVPLLLGGGTRLFEQDSPARLEIAGVLEGPLATHLRYRVSR